MAKKGIISVFLTILVGLSLIIAVPILSISNNFSSYDLIEADPSFYYDPIAPTPIEHLYFFANVGNIEIRYIDPPFDYHAKVDVNIEMSGANLVEMSHEDYFNITWNTSDSTANFTLEVISDDWYNPSLWITQDVSIVVTLRKDIVFDITVEVKYGNTILSIPYGVSVNDIRVNTTSGNVNFNFIRCIIEGNINAKTDEGNLMLNSYDVKYSSNSNWTIINDEGDFSLNIAQYKSIGANITGLADIYAGNLYLTYRDNDPNIGALFTLPLSIYGYTGRILNATGFFPDFFTPSGYNLSSFGYPSNSNYILLFNVNGSDIIDIVSQ